MLLLMDYTLKTPFEYVDHPPVMIMHNTARNKLIAIGISKYILPLFRVFLITYIFEGKAKASQRSNSKQPNITETSVSEPKS